MPFIQRIVEPVFLSRPTQSTATEQPSNNNVTKTTHDEDFTSIANCTLANILRQLASVVLVADEILSDLGNELQTIRDRSNNIQKRIIGVGKSLETVDTTRICKLFFSIILLYNNRCYALKPKQIRRKRRNDLSNK